MYVIQSRKDHFLSRDSVTILILFYLPKQSLCSCDILGSWNGVGLGGCWTGLGDRMFSMVNKEELD